MAFSLIGHTVASSSNGGVSVTTTGFDTTGANLLVATGSYYATLAGTSFTDSKGNTWTKLATQGGSFLESMYWCYAPTVGAGHTFSISGATTYSNLAVQAWSGSAASPQDLTSGASASQPGSITPTAANELVVSGAAAASGAAMTVDSGMTVTDTAVYTAGQSLGIGMAYIVQTAATAINPIWSAPVSGCTIVSFKVSAGGGVVASVQYRSLIGVGV